MGLEVLRESVFLRGLSRRKGFRGRRPGGGRKALSPARLQRPRPVSNGSRRSLSSALRREPGPGGCLVNMDGELLPGGFITDAWQPFPDYRRAAAAPGRGRAKKNLFDKKNADEGTAQKQNPKLSGSHRRVIDSLYLRMAAASFQVSSCIPRRGFPVAPHHSRRDYGMFSK